METSNKTANQILLSAATLLEEEGKWNKGSFFKPLLDRPGCAMCAHGAIAYCGDPEAKIQVDQGNSCAVTNEAAEVGRASDMALWEEYYSRLAYQEGLSFEDYIVKRFGQVGLAHFKASQAGLTFEYNDNPSTSQQDVVRKLREAAV